MTAWTVCLLGMALLIAAVAALRWHTRRLADTEAQAVAHYGILYQELQHRTANGLQTIASILSMQATRIADTDDAAEALQDATLRLRAVAAVHARLHHPGLGKEGMAAALEGLVRDILRGAGREDVVLSIDIHATPIPQRDATLLAMLVVEAVQNALKHGLRGRKGGLLQVSLQDAARACHRLEVTDDGPGFPATPGPAATIPSESRSLGMSIMQHLAKQLNGALHIDNAQPAGARVAVEFCISEA